MTSQQYEPIAVNELHRLFEDLIPLINKNENSSAASVLGLIKQVESSIPDPLASLTKQLTATRTSAETLPCTERSLRSEHEAMPLESRTAEASRIYFLSNQLLKNVHQLVTAGAPYISKLQAQSLIVEKAQENLLQLTTRAQENENRIELTSAQIDQGPVPESFAPLESLLARQKATGERNLKRMISAQNVADEANMNMSACSLEAAHELTPILAKLSLLVDTYRAGAEVKEPHAEHLVKCIEAANDALIAKIKGETAKFRDEFITMKVDTVVLELALLLIRGDIVFAPELVDKSVEYLNTFNQKLKVGKLSGPKRQLIDEEAAIIIEQYRASAEVNFGGTLGIQNPEADRAFVDNIAKMASHLEQSAKRFRGKVDLNPYKRLLVGSMLFKHAGRLLKREFDLQ